MTAIIQTLSKNILGTLDIEMKLKGMRKFQDFSVYPIGKEDNTHKITIQSTTRIGYIHLDTGLIQCTRSISSGAYNPHLVFEKLREYQLTEQQLVDITQAIRKTSGHNVGKSIIFSDNSNAKNV